MKTYAHWKSVKIEQAGVTFYDCERESVIEKYDMRLVWTYAMPRKKGKSIMTSINEHVRNVCSTYLEKYQLGVKSPGAEWDYKKVSADMLHGAVMWILADAIDAVAASWEPLFDIDIYIKKNKEKELMNELQWMDKSIKNLEYEIEAKRKVDEIVKRELSRLNMSPEKVALSEKKQTEVTVQQVQQRAQQAQVWKPIPKPKAKSKWLQMDWFTFQTK